MYIGRSELKRERRMSYLDELDNYIDKVYEYEMNDNG